MSALYNSAQALDPSIAARAQLLEEIATWNHAMNSNRKLQIPLAAATQEYYLCKESERPRPFLRVKLFEQLQRFYRSKALESCVKVHKMTTHMLKEELPKIATELARNR